MHLCNVRSFHASKSPPAGLCSRSMQPFALQYIFHDFHHWSMIFHAILYRNLAERLLLMQRHAFMTSL